MNKIYKVIWSKAKNAYVVVSEMAKNHTKSASSRSKVTTKVANFSIATLVALITTSVIAPVDVYATTYDGKYGSAWNAIDTLYFVLFGPDTSKWPNGSVLQPRTYWDKGYTFRDGIAGQANSNLKGLDAGAHILAMSNYGSTLGAFRPDGSVPSGQIYSVLLNDTEGYGYSNYNNSGYFFTGYDNNILGMTMMDSSAGYQFAAGKNSVFIGNKAFGMADNSVVIGQESRVYNDYVENKNYTNGGYNASRSVAIGYQAVVANDPFNANRSFNMKFHGSADDIDARNKTTWDNNKKANTPAVAGQGVAIGSGAVAAAQATSVGNDTYALGYGAIAIGSDDNPAYYGNKVTDYDYVTYFKSVYDKLNGTTAWKYGVKNAIQGLNMTNNQLDKSIYSPTLAQGSGSISIGTRSFAYDIGSTAVGAMAYALKPGFTAIGAESRSEGQGSIAVGNKALVFSDNAIGTGNEVQVLRKGGAAYGYKAYASGENSLAIGTNVFANSAINYNTNINSNSLYPGGSNGADSATTVQNSLLGASMEQIVQGIVDGLSVSQLKAKLEAGDHKNSATTKYLIAKLGEKDATLMGVYGSIVSDPQFLQAAKYDSTESVKVISGNDKILVDTQGYHGIQNEVVQNASNKKNAIVIGISSSARDDNTIALGYGTNVRGDSAVALGSFAYTERLNAMALGTMSKSFSENATALGTGAIVNVGSKNATAIGAGAFASGVNSMVLGVKSKTDAANTIAIGVNALANLKNSVALGVNSETDYLESDLDKAPWMQTGAIAIPTTRNTGVISVGRKNEERRIVNVASGLRDTDAVNVSQLRSLSEKFNLDLNAAKQGSGMHYLSVNDTAGSAAATLKSKIGIVDNYKDYVRLKERYISYQIRQKLGGETFNQESLNAIKAEIDRLQQAGLDAKLPADNRPNGFNYSDFASALKNVEDELALIAKSANDAENEETVKRLLSELDAAGKTAIAVNIGNPIDEAQLKTELEAANFNNTGAKGKDSIAIGFAAKTDATSTESVAIGRSANVGTDSSNAIAIGKNAESKYGSIGAVVIGEHAHVNGTDSKLPANQNKAKYSVAVGRYARVDNSRNAVAIGNGAEVKASSGQAIAIGGYFDSVDYNGLTDAQKKNTPSETTNVDTNSPYAIAFGSGAVVHENAPSSIAMGKGVHVWQNAPKSIAIGTSEDIPDDKVATADKADYRTYIGGSTTSAIAMGTRAQVRDGGNYSIALGKNPVVMDNAQDAIAIGSASFVGKASNNSIAIGKNAQVGDNTNKADATNTTSAIALGDNAVVMKGGNNSIALGKDATVSAEAKDSVAIGSNSNVWKELNNGNVAKHFGGSDTYDSTKGVDMSRGGTTGGLDYTGLVSIGNGTDGKIFTRRIVNLAAGVRDTDAVNVAQLKSLASNKIFFGADTGTTKEMALGDTNPDNKAADRLKFEIKGKAGSGISTSIANDTKTINIDIANYKFKSNDNTTGVDMKQNDILDIRGGSGTAGDKTKFDTENTYTYFDNATNAATRVLRVAISKNPRFDSLKLGTTADATTISNARGVLTFTGAGNTTVKLTNLTEGTLSSTSKDAVTGKQLHEVKEAVNAINVDSKLDSTKAKFGIAGSEAGAGEINMSGTKPTLTVTSNNTNVLTTAASGTTITIKPVVADATNAKTFEADAKKGATSGLATSAGVKVYVDGIKSDIDNNFKNIYEGAAGTMVYTDASGARLLKNGAFFEKETDAKANQTAIEQAVANGTIKLAQNGIYYEAAKVGGDGALLDSNAQPYDLSTLPNVKLVKPDAVFISAVNGTTSTVDTIALRNVKSMEGNKGKVEFTDEGIKVTSTTGTADKSITIGKAGIAMADTKVTGLAKGTADTDVVNLSQLKGAATALGGGARISAEVGKEGTFIAPTYNLKTKATGTIDAKPTGADNRTTTSYNNVGSALEALDKAVVANHDNIANLTTTLGGGAFTVAGDVASGTSKEAAQKLGQKMTLTGAEQKTGAQATDKAQLIQTTVTPVGTAGETRVELSLNTTNLAKAILNGTDGENGKNGKDALLDGLTVAYKGGTDTQSKTTSLAAGLNFQPGTGTVAKGAAAAATDSQAAKKGVVIETGASGLVTIGLDADTRTKLDNIATNANTAYANVDLGNITAQGKSVITGLIRAQAATPASGDENLAVVTESIPTSGTDKTKTISVSVSKNAITTAAKAAAKEVVKVSKATGETNITVTPDTTTTTGVTDYKVGLGEALTNINSVTSKQNTDLTLTRNGGASATFGANTVTIMPTAGKVITFINDGKITGVTEAALNDTSTDVVVGKQLHATNTKVEKHEQNIQNISSQINNLTSGAANTMVYTNENGEKLANIGGKLYKAAEVAGKRLHTDGKWYDNNQFKADGSLVDNATQSAVQPTELSANSKVQISAVDPTKADATATTTPMALANVGSIAGNGTTAALTANGLAVTNGTGTDAKTITIGKAGIAMGDTKITGLAAGTAEADAVNIGQLQALGLDPTAVAKKPVVTYDSDTKA